MVIRLIYPRFINDAGVSEPYQQQNLTLIYLAALTPSEFDVEIIDENRSEVTYDTHADLVGISSNVLTFSHAHEIIKNYKHRGITVVQGGFYPSLFPEKALEHADSIVVGEAELVWEELLSDFRKGKLKPIYKSDKLSDLKNLPIPRYDLYNPLDFHNVFSLFITRGCPQNCKYRYFHSCNFCSIKYIYGSTYRKRPIGDVINQIHFIKKEYGEERSFPLSLLFVDDNLWGDIKYAKELFQSLIPLNIPWATQGASLSSDDELLELAARSGCYLLFAGFESFNPHNLKFLNKNHNEPELYGEFIAKLHQLNIAVGAYFMVGLPFDDQSCFDTLAEFMENNYVTIPKVSIYIPEREQLGEPEIGDKTNITGNYTSPGKFLPIFAPQGMTKNKFKYAYLNFNRKIFSDESIERRLKNCDSIACYFINKGYQNFFADPTWDEWADK